MNTTEQEQQTQQQQQQKQVQLSDISVDNENVALNVMVAMLNMAQRRGAFSMEESSKCWDCVKMFMKQSAADGTPALAEASTENTVM